MVRLPFWGEGIKLSFWRKRDKTTNQQVKKLVKELFPELSGKLGIKPPCEEGLGCKLIGSESIGLIKRRERKLYCWDEPDHFCSCLIEIKDNKQRTKDKATVTQIDREELEKHPEIRQIIAGLKDLPEEPRKLVIATYSINNKGRSETRKQLLKDIKEMVDLFRPERKKKFEELGRVEQERYMAATTLREGKLAIVPYNARVFRKTKELMKEWAEVMRRNIVYY